MKLRLLSMNYVSAVDALPSTICTKTNQALVWWRLQVSTLAGSIHPVFSHRQLIDAYTNNSKSHFQFDVSGHRDISHSVFPRRHVVTKLQSISDEKSRDRELTARWLLDLTGPLPSAKKSKPDEEVLMSYYVDGVHYEEVVKRRRLPSLLTHSILYHTVSSR